MCDEAKTFFTIPGCHGACLSRFLSDVGNFCSTLHHDIIGAGSFASSLEAIRDKIADVQRFATYDTFDVNEDTGDRSQLVSSDAIKQGWEATRVRHHHEQ